MALTSDNTKAMKTLSAMTPAQISDMLSTLAAQADQAEQSDDEAVRRNAAMTWRQAMNIVVLTLWTEHKGTRNGVKGLVKKTGALEGILAMIANGSDDSSAVATAPRQVVPGAGQEVRLDALGQPITDADQLEAERIADETFGPRGGGAPQPQRQQFTGTPTTVDGTPITDPGLLEAEAILGPR